VGENQIERYYILSIKSAPKSPEGDLFKYKPLSNPLQGEGGEKTCRMLNYVILISL